MTETIKPTVEQLQKERAIILKQAMPELALDTKLDLHRIADNMHHTREVHKAVGLAANQVGIALRMFVMGNAFAQFTCINPEILETSETKEKASEGCLSFPHLLLKVERPTKVKVRYLDVDLKEVECEFEGLFARCFQHELDHLNGVTFDTQVSKLSLAMARKKQQRLRRYK